MKLRRFLLAFLGALITVTAGLAACNDGENGQQPQRPEPIVLDAPQTRLDGNELSWYMVVNASGYEVYESVNGAAAVKVADKSAAEFSYTISRTEVGTYAYYVKAVSGGEDYISSGLSSPAVTYTVQKPEPVQLSAPVVSLNGITVSWTAVANASGYEVYESVNGAAAVKVADKSAAEFSYTISRTEVGSYSYTVKAISNSEDYISSGLSSPAVTYTVQKPEPVQLSVPVVSLNGVTVSWTAVTNASGYEVYETTSGSAVKVSEQSTTGYTVDKSVPGTYKFKVKAKSGGEDFVDSALSDEVSVTFEGVTVTFDTAGGTPEPSPVTVIKGAKIDEPQKPTKSGSAFLYWAVADTETEFDFEATPVTADLALVAVWGEAVCTVVFLLDDGTVYDIQYIEAGGYAVKVALDPTSPQKEFDYWAADGARYSFDGKVTGNVTLTVVWKDKQNACVNFESNGGSAVEAQYVRLGEKLNEPAAPTRDGLSFGGWFADEKLVSAFDFNSPVTKDATLYAKWVFPSYSDVVTSTTVWKFGPDYGASTATYYVVNGNTLQGSSAQSADGYLSLDATRGKLAPHGSWYQFNEGAKIVFKVSGECTVTATSYSQGAIAVNGAAASGSTSVSQDLYGDNLVTVEALKNDYISSITVTFASAVAAFTESTTIKFGTTELGGNYETFGDKLVLNYTGKRNQNEMTQYAGTITFAVKSGTEIEIKTHGGDYTDCVVELKNSADTLTVNAAVYKFTVDGDETVVLTSGINNYYYYVKITCSSGTGGGTVVYPDPVAMSLSCAQPVILTGSTVSGAYVTAKVAYSDGSVKYKTTNMSFDFSSVNTAREGKYAVRVFYTERGTTLTGAYFVKVYRAAQPVNGSVTLYVNKNKPEKEFNFTSIGDALSYLAVLNPAADIVKVINIADGEYYEKITVNIPNVRFVGSDTVKPDSAKDNGVVIWFDAMAGITNEWGALYGTNGSATVTVASGGYGFAAYNVTIKNKYNTYELYKQSEEIFKSFKAQHPDLYKDNLSSAATQAVALYVEVAAQFYNCKLTGYHDTLYANKGMQYYYGCWIEGHTDYIFGSLARAYFYKCDIWSLGDPASTNNGGYVVATSPDQSRPGNPFYYVFNGCRFGGDANCTKGTVALGRAWGAEMTIVIINSTISDKFSTAAHTKGTQAGQRYCTMSGNEPDPARIIEAGNTGAGAVSASLANTCTVDAAALTTYAADKISTILGFTPEIRD